MQLTYENDNFYVTVDGTDYVCGVTALADYSYDPGRMYYPDGTGCPPDDDLEIISVSVYNICEEDDQRNQTPVTDTGLTAKICDAVDAALYDMGLDNWDGCEDEPEYEE